jgi:hypothetical protein
MTTPFYYLSDIKGVSNTVKDGVRTISYKGTDEVKMYFGLKPDFIAEAMDESNAICEFSSV